jgi:hypothetical protein
MKNPTYFSVRPRYTPGSPGQVDEQMAQRVASQEKETYEVCLEGVYGEGDLHKAKEMGLKGIVESMTEYKGGWKIVDMITGEKCWRGNVKPSKIQRGDRLIEQRATVENTLGKHSHFGSINYAFYTDNRDAGNPNGYRTYNANDLVKIERAIKEDI